MDKTCIAAALAAVLVAAPASAQAPGQGHHGHQPGTGSPGGAPAQTTMLPQGCLDAVAASGPAAPTGSADDAAGLSGSIEGMDDAQAASMAAMMRMNQAMMATHAIADPDLAFNCGMIAHHAGAIAMAEVELEYGRDDAAKAMARRIIDAQGPEIAEMTAWVEAYRPRD